MALPKKGLRKINVNDVDYVWMTKSKYGEGCSYMTISISPLENQAKILQVHELYAFQELNLKNLYHMASKHHESIQKSVISPRMIREIILTALKNGWAEAPDGVFWLKQDAVGDLPGHLFHHYKEAFEGQEHKLKLDCYFELDALQIRLKQTLGINYLNIEMWTYSPDKQPEEFFHLFHGNAILHSERHLKQDFYPVEDFIVKMLVRYARFHRTPLEKICSELNFVNRALTKKELKTFLLNFLSSEKSPRYLQQLKITHGNQVFHGNLISGVIARSEEGMIGLIWENAG